MKTSKREGVERLWSDSCKEEMNSTSPGSTKSAQWWCLCRGDISGAKLLFRMLTQFNNFMEVSTGFLFIIELTTSYSYWSPLDIQASVKICYSPCICDVLSIKVRNNFKTKIFSSFEQVEYLPVVYPSTREQENPAEFAERVIISCC